MRTPFNGRLILAIGLIAAGTGSAELDSSSRANIGHPSLLSPHASPITCHGDRVFVVNTPSDTVDVIDVDSRKIVARVDVGIDPVSIAVRPDGREVWVSNHVSDSVSVIDSAPESPTYLQVLDTIQDFDREKKATRFDEPVGIAFAGNEKAYVALSSENRIAIVDVAERKVSGHLAITAQDPRAIIVWQDRLFVIPFESNNKTQLSGGYRLDGDLVTFNAHEHSIANNNVLSIGHVLDIVKHPRVPDRDLYVFDTRTDELIEVVDTLGTLLYGLAVDSAGQVFIAQTDARNDVNGRAGTKKQGLAELGNRAFLNQITRVRFDGDEAESRSFIDLEPLPPSDPAPGEALATPFAIQISDDDSTLVVSAAGSDKVFTVNAETGEVLGRVAVDAVPRGIVLESTGDGKPFRAWVLNAVANTVSLVDVSDPTSITLETSIILEDPTHPDFKKGRMAFNQASASTTGTFSCASCHPDGHTDQLLWVLKTPVVTGGDQIMPRSTMPLRGLRDTAPFHWDGIPGDPYGGNNSASIRRPVEPNCPLGDPESTTRHVVDGSLASTMLKDGHEVKNDEGKSGLLSAADRDAIAKFLLNVPFPPAQRRAYNNELSDRAAEGFELFHIKGDVGGTPGANLCGNCHRMPFLVSTNTPGSGMDAPTWRGAYDRFLILPQGRLNIIDFDFYRRIAEEGIPERKMWQFSWGGRQAFDPVWDMVLEGSTGHSGSFGRQVTMNVRNADTYLTHDLLDALETASEDGGVVLLATGMFLENGSGRPVTLRYDPQVRKGAYIDVANDDRAYKRDELAGLARSGEFVGTFTGRHGPQDDYDHPQPGLWTLSSLHAQEGQQEFPILHGDEKTMRLHGRHVRSGAHVHVNGRRVDGEVRFGEDERLDITLETLPPVGLHFLQVQNPGGLFSNDFIFHVAETEEKATALRYANNPDLLRDGLARAIENGRLEEVSNLVDAGAPIDARRRATGMTPLSTAVFQGHFDIARYLIEEKGAAVSRANRDGNTPLHLAAFLCRIELVKLLLEHGASLSVESDRGESPIDVVSSPWNDGLAGFYRSISEGSGLDLDLEELERRRPRLVRLLREAAGGPKNALSLLPRGADGWRFEDSGTAVPESWAARAFDDSEWKRGSAPLGYGEEGLASRVRFGPNPRRKFPAAFFRRTFSVDHPGASETFAGGIRADDGAVIYLNGQEIHRLRMPDGKIDHRTFAADSTESESGLEGRYTLFSIPAKVLKKGGNVISVSVHQRHGASSDLVLDLELLGLSREDLPRYQRSLEE